MKTLNPTSTHWSLFAKKIQQWFWFDKMHLRWMNRSSNFCQNVTDATEKEKSQKIQADYKTGSAITIWRAGHLTPPWIPTKITTMCWTSNIPESVRCIFRVSNHFFRFRFFFKYFDFTLISNLSQTSLKCDGSKLTDTLWGSYKRGGEEEKKSVLSSVLC